MPKQPNLVIFNPDQWRTDVLGHMGNPAASTPTLDRLVTTEAVSFRNAFCHNPVCTPSRCSFMTGLYPHVRGHRTMYHMLHAEHGETNLLRVLRGLGYHVRWHGKNDLVPGQNGFAGDCDVHFQPTEADWQRWGHHHAPNLHNLKDWRGAPPPAGDNYYSFYGGRLEPQGDDIWCDFDYEHVFGAIDFIRGHDGKQPFCLFLPLQHPHPPYCIEEPWFSLTDRAKLPPRIPTVTDWTGKPCLLRGIAERQHLQGWTEARWTELRATYYGMCARLDHQLKLLLDALREKNLYDDTALFMFSDHGDFTGDYGLVEKTQNTFEDCLTRVPLIVKPPKNTAVRPRVSDALVELVDFPATVYELLGIDPGYDHFGRSLLPLLAGETDQLRDAVFCEGGRRRHEPQASERDSTSSLNPEGLYWPRVGLQQVDDPPYHTKATMCRTRDWKYVRRLYEPDELYDLRADPRELRNLIDDPRHRETLATLRERMLAWYQETCDTVPRKTDKR